MIFSLMVIFGHSEKSFLVDRIRSMVPTRSKSILFGVFLNGISCFFFNSHGKVNLKTGLMENGILIGIGEIAPQLLRGRDNFLACSICGKGSHWNRFLSPL